MRLITLLLFIAVLWACTVRLNNQPLPLSVENNLHRLEQMAPRQMTTERLTPMQEMQLRQAEDQQFLNEMMARGEGLYLSPEELYRLQHPGSPVLMPVPGQ